MKLLSTLVTLGVTAAAAAVSVSPADDELKVPGDNPLTYCEKPDDYVLSVKNVDLDPNPPKPGQDLLITASGTLSESVEKGSYVLLMVKYGLITLIKTREDLCDQLEKVDRSCPLDDGELVFKKSVSIPERIPPGEFTVHADVYSKDDKKITCMEAKNLKFNQVGSFGDLAVAELNEQ